VATVDDKLGLQLKGLSVAELEDLRTRASKELTAKLTEQVDFQKFHFCPCDDRSMGRLTFTAKTEHGLVEYRAYLGNGYTDEEACKLTAEPEEGFEEGDELDLDVDLDLPAFHDNTTEDLAKQECAKAVLAWSSEYGG
jgi:hypothetical protein